MARRAKGGDLESRTKREKKKVRAKPYYVRLGENTSLGYRKGKRERPWILRRYIGGKDYTFESIGVADDFAEADGETILTFDQAADRARERAKIAIRKAGPYTVGDAIRDYVLELGDRSSAYETKMRLAANVPLELAGAPVSQITAKMLQDWHRELALAPPRKRTKRGVEQQYRDVDLSDETVRRRRRVSANRCLAQLKRALQLAREEGHHSNDDWKRAKMFQRVEAPREAFLTVAEAGRLANACGPELRELVQAGLVTGCRYSELGRLRVGDFNPDSGTLQIRISKTGKMRHVYLADEGVAFFAGLTAGRQGGDRMLSREWGRSQQNRPMREACARAKIDPPVGFHQLRHTWASLAVMNGVPLMVVARNLGHVDTSMVEKHYGHLAPNYISSAIKAGAPVFGFAGSNVRAIR